MTVSSRPLTQDEQNGQVIRPCGGHDRIFLQAPNGYVSWRGWLAGKGLPLAIFIMALVVNSQALPHEVARAMRDGLPLHSLMQLLRQSLMLGFFLFIAAAYLTRTRAVTPARGFWEKGFPFLVLCANFVGMSLLERSAALERLDLIMVGLLLTLLGYCVSLWALWHLQSSFAIMAEARSPVMSGPYQYIRHPLYLGELLALLGLCLAMGTVPAILFWVVLTGMQLMRASIEETKLARQFADYRAYLERTRFVLPGLY